MQGFLFRYPLHDLHLFSSHINHRLTGRAQLEELTAASDWSSGEADRHINFFEITAFVLMTDNVSAVA